jgi:hypothetical protein
MLAKVAGKDTQTVVCALIKQAKKLPKELYKSLTWDRGKELTDHRRFTLATKGAYLEPAAKLAHKTTFEGYVAVVRRKNDSTTWNDVKTVLMDFDRAGLRGLVQDLYTVSKDNQAFLHARLGLGDDQLKPFKASISRWISPDLMKGQPISVSKAKKAIADYKKAIGRPDGIAELSIFYCEEAFGFLESCSMDDEKYFAALIRMYGQSLEIVFSLPPPERSTYLGRLDRLRSRGRNVGWVVEEEFNSLWHETVDEEDSE